MATRKTPEPAAVPKTRTKAAKSGAGLAAGATPAPAGRKKAPSTRAEPAPPVTKAAGKVAPARNGAPSKKSGNAAPAAADPLSPEDRYRMICDAAYYIAERRGFAPGDPMADWLEAERQVDAAWPAAGRRGG